uniref:SFRICE_011864 n=1 Tax=Spodoptera frugiperda TaxID=7108 RepID=A0A2H1V6Q3_SPOFR
MDEESMWKGFYDKLQQQKSIEEQAHDYKIQEVDDSFFEKFGSILKQASQKAALEESTPLAPLKEVEEQDAEQKVELDSKSLLRDSDSGNETLLDTDSEPEEHDKIDRYVEAVGWNVSIFSMFNYFFMEYGANE